MKRWIAGLFLVVGAAGAPLIGDAQTRDRPPEWAPRICQYGQYCNGDNSPSTADLARAYPGPAARAGADGHVRLDCLVTVEGQIRDCRVANEQPAGLGFGQAATLLARQFSMRPAIRGGKPVAERVDIPLAFVFKRTDTQVSSNLPGFGGQETLGMQKYVGNASWVMTPSYADMVAAYPGKAKADGVAARGTLYCTFTAEGTLTACTVENPQPYDPSVIAAIRTLVPRFKAPPTVRNEGGDVSIAGLGVMVPVNFSTRMLQPGAPPLVTAPVWTKVPSNADFAAAFPTRARTIETLKSRVVLQCSVATGGTLAGCRVSSETPAGMGFGDAALALAPKFTVNPWSEEGAPLVGSSVRVPIIYESKGPDAPAAPG